MTERDAATAPPSIAFGIALREEHAASHARILHALRAERLLGVLTVDDAAAATSQGFGMLLADADGHALVVRDDGAVTGLDLQTVAARLQRRLDAAVQLALDDAEPLESAPSGFEPWTTIPEREEAAARAPIRWVAVLPVPAATAARWLTEMATLVDGDVVLVPAGERSLLVCDAWRFASWPRELRPLVSLAQVGPEIHLHAWLRRRIDAGGRARLRVWPTPMPDWSVVWSPAPVGTLPEDGYSPMQPAAVERWRRAQEALVERLEVDMPAALDVELRLEGRRAAVEHALSLDPPQLTAAEVVAALALPEAVLPLLSAEQHAASLPGARTGRSQSLGRTLLGSMRDEVRHGSGGGGLAMGLSVACFLSIGLTIALLAGFGVFTREQTVDNPWFIVVLGVLAVVSVGLGNLAALWARSRRGRRTPIGGD